MTSLRKSIIFMLIHLTIVFNLERFDYSTQNVIDIQTFVYVLIITLIVLTLSIRPLQRISLYVSLLSWMVVYGVLKLIVFNTRPILGDMFTYLTVTEVALIAITVFLAYDLSRTLNDFEDVIEKVTIPRLGQRVLRMREAGEEIKTEFIRSRRHNRPLSVLLVNVNTDTPTFNLEKTVREIQRNMMNRYLASSLSKILSKEARRTDLIVEKDDERGFVMLCPETTAEGTQILAERIQQIATGHLGVRLDYGIASFPDEALTFDELLQRAQENLVGGKPDILPLDSSVVEAEEMKTR